MPRWLLLAGNGGKRVLLTTCWSCSSGLCIGAARGSSLVASEIRRDCLAGGDPQIGAGFGVGEKFPQQTQPHWTTAALRMQHGGHHRAPVPDFVEFILPDREHVLLWKDRPRAESGGQPVH